MNMPLSSEKAAWVAMVTSAPVAGMCGCMGSDALMLPRFPRAWLTLVICSDMAARDVGVTACSDSAALSVSGDPESEVDLPSLTWSARSAAAVRLLCTARKAVRCLRDQLRH